MNIVQQTTLLLFFPFIINYTNTSQNINNLPINKQVETSQDSLKVFIINNCIQSHHLKSTYIGINIETHDSVSIVTDISWGELTADTIECIAIPKNILPSCTFAEPSNKKHDGFFLTKTMYQNISQYQGIKLIQNQKEQKVFSWDRKSNTPAKVNYKE
ncbi:MAG: hypothetical protein MK212_18485 [Saprospiraceae bacterium]|nr:hypothetical protein [Saprospiraceae bacterium]